MTKFKVGDKVIADGDEAVVTEILPAADSDFDKTVSYAVEWLIESGFTQSEWGTFTEDELKRVDEKMNKIPLLERFAAQSLVEHDSELIFSKEKFAQLIVKECADLCDRFQARDVGMQPAECAEAIRRMFGVER